MRYSINTTRICIALSKPQAPRACIISRRQAALIDEGLRSALYSTDLPDRNERRRRQQAGGSIY
jgi:hypothetical protein